MPGFGFNQAIKDADRMLAMPDLPATLRERFQAIRDKAETGLTVSAAALAKRPAPNAAK